MNCVVLHQACIGLREKSLVLLLVGVNLRISKYLMTYSNNFAMNTQGKVLFSDTFSNVGLFSEGYSVVEKNGTEYIVNKYGQKVFDGELYYNSIVQSAKSYISQRQWVSTSDFFQNGVIQFTQRISVSGDRTITYGFCNTKGTILLEPVWDKIYSFSDGLARVETKSSSGKPLFGYVYAKGNIVIKPQYDKASDFSDGFAIVWMDSTWYIINKSGQVIF